MNDVEKTLKKISELMETGQIEILPFSEYVCTIRDENKEKCYGCTSGGSNE